MKRKIIRYIFLFFATVILSLIIRQCIVYYIIKEEENHRIVKIKEIDIKGVIIGNIYNGQIEGYDYYTNDDDLILGKYFFENNNRINLEIGDSVSKVSNELVLEIFRKNETGQYEYLGTSE